MPTVRMRADQMSRLLPDEKVQRQCTQFAHVGADIVAVNSVCIVGCWDGVGDICNGSESIDDGILARRDLEHVCYFPELDEAEVGWMGTVQG